MDLLAPNKGTTLFKDSKGKVRDGLGMIPTKIMSPPENRDPGERDPHKINDHLQVTHKKKHGESKTGKLNAKGLHLHI